MKSNWFQILMIVTLLGLLVLLATLQYQWLGQISESEQVRLEERLKDDTKRFAGDFNSEIQKAYFLFQTSAEDWDSFGKRYELWKEKSEYKDLIKDFYYVKLNEEKEISSLDTKSGKFEPVMWTGELREIAKSFEDEDKYQEFTAEGFSLVLPVHKTRIDLKKMVGQQKKRITLQNKSGKIIREDVVGPEFTKEKADNLIHKLKTPEKEGFLIIRLSKKVVYQELLSNLTNKYFSEKSDGGSYKVSVTDADNKETFKNYVGKIEKSDAEVKLFNLNDKNIFVFAREPFIPLPKNGATREVVWSDSVTSTSIKTETHSSDDSEQTVNVDIISDSEPKTTVIEKSFSESKGIWTLHVQHIDGSLEQFITNTRRRNLAVSFGILSLLAVSIILIFLSSQRVKTLAQKQMNFVSSVSHEFRTPLAVIFTASENLSDGVVKEREKISDYGTLIKREGKKLSGMVEQILEFAGANSGNRKYDFRNVDVKNLIDAAIAECQPFIDEKKFVVEKDISEHLPTILADEKALTLAIQNLINNSLKYSNGSNWLKISTYIRKGNLNISIADKGIGISDKDQKQIFDPFYRAENVVDEQISGNGLGLSLVTQIVDAHGGKIKLESKVGIGSEFIIQVPLKV